jgi:Protein of unknown function (DUF5818)
MKKIVLAVAACMLLLPSVSASANKTYSGVIMDSSCAKMGSHAEMEKMHKMPASDALTGATARKCTLGCVRMGAKFVLYNPATKTTYRLDDQKKPAAFAGEKVRVSGTYDESTQTIHVVSIHKS